MHLLTPPTVEPVTPAKVTAALLDPISGVMYFIIQFSVLLILWSPRGFKTSYAKTR